MSPEIEVAYTLVIKGKPEGPYTIEGLKLLNIRPDSFLRKPGMDDYKEAHEFPELRELFGFHCQPTVPQYFASFDQRLLAMVIDYFLLGIAYVIFALLSFIFVEDDQRIVLVFSGLPLIPLAKLIYGSFSEASVQQAGVGKRLLNIKVSDLNGQRISLSNSFLRNLSKVCSAAPLSLGFLYSFLNKKQQCFHDLIANTLVVKERLI